jgi:hypothetical protein
VIPILPGADAISAALRFVHFLVGGAFAQQWVIMQRIAQRGKRNSSVAGFAFVGHFSFLLITFTYRS